MKTFYNIIFLLIIFSLSAFSQILENYDSGFNTIFDKKEKVSPYYFGNNPAWLNREVSKELLFIRSGYDDESGDFRKFTDPGDIRTYTISASGKKLIDSTQIFRGSFAFRRTENNNWQWLFTRDYSSGSPFLIGDSTTGDTRLNGILMNAQYSAEVINKLNLGFAINYYVDDGLKLAHPRPTSKDREINYSMGLGYKLYDKLSFGINGSVYDNVETINYSQDVGSLLTETIILKFFGYDFPNVYRMKDETRYSYNNGYHAGINILYEDQDNFKLTGFGEFGFNKINIKDGGTSPINEGLWKNNQYNAGMLALVKLTRNLDLGIQYNLGLADDWGEFPDYLVLYSKNNNIQNSFVSGLEYALNDNLSLGFEAGLKLLHSDQNDYYSNISFDNNTTSWLMKFGLKTKIQDNLAMFISAGYTKSNTGANSLSYSSASSYFLNYTINDIYYLLSDFKQYTGNVIVAYTPGFGGEILLNLNYAYTSARNPFILPNSDRIISSVVLEYRVQAY